MPGLPAARLCFAGAALWAHVVRVPHLQRAVADPDIVFVTGWLQLVDRVLLPAPAVWLGWLLGGLGLVGLAVGGRLAKPGLLLWLFAHMGVIAACGLEARVPERALLWVSLGLLCAPIHVPHLKQASRIYRWYFLLLACSIYGSTGWLKILVEPEWWTGAVLGQALVDRHFGLTTVGVWLSAQPVLLTFFSIVTVLFEALFPLLIWFRRLNPWLLVLGICMHLGIEVMMDVGTLTWVVLSMYPILLHPDVARRLTQGRT